ncbi:MAG: HEAT repeat domain-containing protein [Planctomycetes bacterium]|nr:HEAT repeat domain-containing protein [Planctomycetota bacterium]
MRSRHAIFRSLPLLLAACASGPARPELFDPGRPESATQERLVAYEKLYRRDDPAAASERDQLAQDPTSAFWLTRMYVRDILFVREGRSESSARQIQYDKHTPRVEAQPGVAVSVRPSGDTTEMMRQAAKLKNPVETRALEQIDALGERAVPCLVQDLLPRTGISRELGVELLGRIGAPALPGLAPSLQSGDARIRRTAIRAVAAMAPEPAVLASLRAAATDGDFGVRGEAIAGLARGDGDDVVRVRRAVTDDADAFVRRKAAAALVVHRDRATATTLIGFLQRCKSEREAEGERVAQESLARLAGSTGPRTVDMWQRWLQDWDPAARPTGQR